MTSLETTRGNEPLVFQPGIESLHKALKARLTPALQDEIKQLGIDLERPPPAVSLAIWENMIGQIAHKLHPGLPEAERYFELGREFMHGYAATALGTAVVTLARVMGVRRTMHRMGKNFRAIANYIETEVVDTGPNAVELRTWMRPDLLVHHKRPTLIFANYRRGVLHETLALVNTRGTVTISHMDLNTQKVVFTVQWE
jgi:uncharacterized protein (TIGR02265 family)